VRVDAGELKRITRDVIAAGDAYDDENQSGAECDVQVALERAGLTPPDAWANASTSITRRSDPERLALYLTRAPESAGNTAEIVERLEWAWGRFVFKDGAYTIRESVEAVRMDFVTWWDHGGFYTARVKVIPSRAARAAGRVRQRTDRDRHDAKAAYARLYWELREILNRHDPEQLIHLLGPGNEDEYEPMLETVLPRLDGAAGPGDVQQVLHEGFASVMEHNAWSTYEAFEPVAADVWAVWSAYQQRWG